MTERIYPQPPPVPRALVIHTQRLLQAKAPPDRRRAWRTIAGVGLIVVFFALAMALTCLSQRRPVTRVTVDAVLRQAEQLDQSLQSSEPHP